jgi:plastocyanin
LHRRGPAYGRPSAGSAATVTATNNLNFEPRTLGVAVGDAVEWRNKSLFTHTVTLTADKGVGNEDMELPDDAEPFDAGLPQGQLFRHTFSVPGTYRYICEPHNFLGIVGPSWSRRGTERRPARGSSTPGGTPSSSFRKIGRPPSGAPASHARRGAGAYHRGIDVVRLYSSQDRARAHAATTDPAWP